MTRSLLIGTTQPFKIHTDHRNLTYFCEPQKLTSRQVNWTTKLQDFDFVIKHISGTSNVLVDVLSRPDRVEKGPWTTDTLLPDWLFARYLAGEDEQDDQDEGEHQRSPGEIISENHDIPMAGHLGVRQTLALLARKGHGWKGMWKDIKAYVQGC
jgi:hypothetical protein